MTAETFRSTELDTSTWFSLLLTALSTVSTGAGATEVVLGVSCFGGVNVALGVGVLRLGVDLSVFLRGLETAFLERLGEFLAFVVLSTLFKEELGLRDTSALEDALEGDRFTSDFVDAFEGDRETSDLVETFDGVRDKSLLLDEIEFVGDFLTEGFGFVGSLALN